MENRKRTVREVTETVLDWEKRFRVQSIRYGRLRVWPLLRLQLVKILSGGAGLEKACENVRFKSGAEFLPPFEHYPEIKPGRVLFWAQASKFVSQDYGRFHRFFDPLLDFGGQGRKEHSFWIWEDGHELPNEEVSGLTKITPWLGPLIEHAVHTSPGEKLNLAGRKFLEAWNAEASLSDIDPGAFEKLCHQVTVWSAFFEKCFKGKRPSSVFLTCFYAELTMALTLACRRQRIPCVELQHGQQGEWHTMYTHWSRLPRRGYDLIPDQFWMWGVPAARRVQAWLRSPGRQVFVGGNPWLGWRSEKARFQDESPEGSAFVRGREERRTILVSLQFSELPDFVWHTIAKRTKDRWLLRMHPRFLNEESKFLKECAERLPDGNWEVSEASRADFYDLLPDADVHITGWSTTAFEALAFGVPTILIHPNGLDAMRESVESGVFGYADNAAKLGELLDTPPMEAEKEPTILADREQILSAWKKFA